LPSCLGDRGFAQQPGAVEITLAPCGGGIAFGHVLGFERGQHLRGGIADADVHVGRALQMKIIEADVFGNDVAVRVCLVKS